MITNTIFATSNVRRKLRHKLDQHKKLRRFSTSAYLKYCSLTGSLHVLPDFLIIGFVKCGTTSLYEYLLQHPSVYPSVGKEIDYFDRLYHRGLNWYRAGFPFKFQKFFRKNCFGKNFVTGEATPRYIESPHALERIKKIIPNAKFIVLLRNPVDRAYSHYNQNISNEYEYLSFEEAIKQEKARITGRYEKMKKVPNYYSWDYDLFGYLEHGIYVDKLKKWFDVFPKEQFLIIENEDFLKHSSQVYHRVLNFLNLPKWEPEKYTLFKKRDYKKSTMDSTIRKQLVEFFHPYNEKLYDLIGINFHWDS